MMLAINAIITSVVAIGIILMFHRADKKLEPLLYTICLFALEIGAAKLLLNLYPSLATALLLTCIMSPCLEEVVRSIGRSRSNAGGFNVDSISLSIGGVEATIKAAQFYLASHTSVDHSLLFIAGVISASLTSILFHANVGVLWNHLARNGRLPVVTLECFLVHAAYNVTLAIVGAISAGIAIYTNICVAILNAAALAGWLLFRASSRTARIAR